MCIPTKLQQNIIDRTREGDTIAAFLVSTMRGETPGVKVNHRMDAAKQLIKYGFPDTQCDNIPSLPHDDGESADQSPLSPRERVRACPELAEGVRGKEIAEPISYLDILNYEIAHLIRHETADGHTVVNFLVDIMTGRDRPFTPKKFRIKPADRMAAARELLRRGFGDFGSRRKLSDTSDEANAYDTLHTDLAKRMREYSERGTDTIRFLLELMSDPDPDKEFTIHHRMSAAQELLRRGWDTNYDNIKPKHLQDYWRDKESSRLSIGQKKTQAGLPTSIDDYDNYDAVDYEAIAKEIREEEDRDDNSKPLRFQETVPSSRHSSESRNPEDLQGVIEIPHLPQGEGWGEDSKNPSSSKSTPAEAKYRRIDVKPEKNIYDYGPNDLDPTIDYYFEPLSPEEQAQFDEEERREYGLTDDEAATNGSANLPSPNGTTDSLAPIKQAATLHGIPILPNPLAAKHKNPNIRSP